MNVLLLYKMKILRIIPYVISLSSIGFVIFILAKVINHTLS